MNPESETQNPELDANFANYREWRQLVFNSRQLAQFASKFFSSPLRFQWSRYES